MRQQNLTFTNNKMLNVQFNIQLLAIIEPFDCFNLFLTNDIMKIMVLETKKNAKQSLKNNKISRIHMYRAWEPITFQNMTKFIGLLLWMGVIKYPSISDY